MLQMKAVRAEGTPSHSTTSATLPSVETSECDVSVETNRNYKIIFSKDEVKVHDVLDVKQTSDNMFYMYSH